MQHFWDDLRNGLRQHARRPGTAIVAVALLSVGIGAAALLHGAYRALLLAPVGGLAAPERLVDIGRAGSFDTLSAPAVRALGELPSLATSYGYTPAATNLRIDGQTVRGFALLVTGDYFRTLGAAPAVGRLLEDSDDRSPGAAEAVVLGHRVWRRQFAADPEVVGRTLEVSGTSFTIVGVAGSGFRGHLGVLEPDLFLPLSAAPQVGVEEAQSFSSPNSSWLLAGGRLAPGATLTGLRAELALVAARQTALRADDLEPLRLDALPLVALPALARRPIGAFSAALGVLILLLLAVACANVAGLLLTAGERRTAELGLRAVLGAARGRLLRQILLESLPIAFAATLAGLLLALLGRDLLLAVPLPLPLPIRVEIPFDPVVVLSTLALAVATVLLAALAPALRMARAPLRPLVDRLGAHHTARRSRARRLLVTSQVAFSLALLVVASLLGRSLAAVAGVDPGFRVERSWAVDLDLAAAGVAEADAGGFAERVLERVRGVPGIGQAALTRVLPLDQTRMGLGGFRSAGGEVISPDANLVSDGYFATLGTPLQGRDFARTDRAGAERVAIVNETLAQRLGGGDPVLGRVFDWLDSDPPTPVRVVAVADDGRYASYADQGTPFVWFPLGQVPHTSLHLVLDSARSATDLTGLLQQAWSDLDRQLPPPQPVALRDIAALSLLPQRIAGALAGLLGAVALSISAAGLYALVAYEVLRRVRELGLRMALGADRRRLFGQMIGEGLRPIGAGLAAGLVASLGLGVLLRGLLIEVQPADPLALAASLGVLGLATLLACALPARRALDLEPMQALRQD